MTNPEQLSGIIKRILDGRMTDDDRQTLQNWVQAGTQWQTVQVEKYNINIGEGKDIQIGDASIRSLILRRLKQPYGRFCEKFRLGIAAD